MPVVRQASFSAGELSPSMWGRTDSPKYPMGLRRCYNFFVSKQGTLISRPGTQYLGLASNAVVSLGPPGPTYAAGGVNVRLIPFYYSDVNTSQNYVLEVGGGYIRIWQNGVAAGSLTTSYLPADLYKIRYVQSGDVVFIACAGYPPATISRSSTGTFSYAAISFARPAPDASLNPKFSLDADANLGVVDTSHPKKPWSWQVTEIFRNTSTGLITESLPVQVTQTYNNAGGSYANPGGAIYTIPLYPDRTAILQMSTASSPPSGFISFRVYRGRGNVYGWVGDTDQNTFVDDGAAPDYTLQPPQGLNPFEVRDPVTKALIRTENPVTVCFFEDRLCFVGTTERPNYLFMSRVSDYYNFDSRLVQVDDESLVFALSGRRRELAVAAVGRERLFILTSSALWVCGGSNGEAISPHSVDIHPHVDIGADWPAPLPIDNGLMWVRNKGTGVRRLAYDYRVARFSSVDMSINAEHLFLGYTIKDWCYAEDPWAQVWAVRSDGKLLSMAYSHDDDVYGWAQHDIYARDNGGGPTRVQSVCTIPEGTEDVVYLAVDGPPNPAWSSATTYSSGDLVNYNGVDYQSLANANTNNIPSAPSSSFWQRLTTSGGPAMILRMVSRVEANRANVVCLDAHQKFTGVTASGSVNLNVGTRFGAQQVYANVNGAISGPYTVTGGNVLNVPANGSNLTIYVGLRYSCEFDLLDLAEGRTRQKVVNDVGLELLIQSGGVVLAGQDTSGLTPLAPSKSNGINPDLIRIPITGSWNSGGRASLQSIDSRPVTVLGVTREVDVGHG